VRQVSDKNQNGNYRKHQLNLKKILFQSIKPRDRFKNLRFQTRILPQEELEGAVVTKTTIKKTKAKKNFSKSNPVS